MSSASLISIGLILNFAGAILLAFSFSVSEPQGTTTFNKGKKGEFVLTAFHKQRFRLGIWILAAGFLLQLFAVIFLN